MRLCVGRRRRVLESCNEPDICEAAKCILPVIRGRGWRKLALALDHAREQGLNAAIWKQRLLRGAIALYERLDLRTY